MIMIGVGDIDKTAATLRGAWWLSRLFGGFYWNNEEDGFTKKQSGSRMLRHSPLVPGCVFQFRRGRCSKNFQSKPILAKQYWPGLESRVGG